MKLLAPKFISFIAQLFVYFWLSQHAHEVFHALAAQAVNIPGHIIVWQWGFRGRFIYEATPTVFQDIVIGLAGGLGVALLFGLLWANAHWQGQYSEWELDAASVFVIIAIVNLFYAPSEVFRTWWEPSQVIGALLAAAALMLLYGKRLLDWLFGKKAEI